MAIVTKHGIQMESISTTTTSAERGLNEQESFMTGEQHAYEEHSHNDIVCSSTGAKLSTGDSLEDLLGHFGRRIRTSSPKEPGSYALEHQPGLSTMERHCSG